MSNYKKIVESALKKATKEKLINENSSDTILMILISRVNIYF